MTAIVEFDRLGAETMRAALGPDASTLPDLTTLQDHLAAYPQEDCVVLGPSVSQVDAGELAESMRIRRPNLGVVLVRQRIDAVVLTEALRSGIREVVPDRDLGALAVAVQRVHDVAARQRSLDDNAGEGPNPSRRARVVTVFSAKGGCGKTTLATNMAAALASSGRGNVVLVDLDLAFGDVAIALQLFPTHTISDAIAMGSSLDAPALMSMLTAHRSGLQVLVAPLEPSRAELVTTELVVRIIDLLSEQFDYVVIDTPPALDDHVLAAFDRSDLVALLATLDIPALKNLKLTLETLELIAFPKEKLAVVLNRADSKVGLALNEVEKTLKAPIAVQIPSSRDVPASTNRGVPLITDEPRHPVSLAIRGFLDDYVVRSTAEDAIPRDIRSDRRGGRLWRRG